jgi:hypothetical protein
MSHDPLYGLLPSFINNNEEEIDNINYIEEEEDFKEENDVEEDEEQDEDDEEEEEYENEEKYIDKNESVNDIVEENEDIKSEKKIIFLKEPNNNIFKVEKIIPEEEKVIIIEKNNIENYIEDSIEKTIEEVQIPKESIKLCVYDNYIFDFNKYPRKKSDIIIIIFLLHEQFLIKLSETYDYAVQQYHQCKDYFHIFKFEPYKESRKYSAKDIIFLINKTNEYFLENPNNYQLQLKYLHRFHILDQIYYFYIRNKNFYLQLYKNIHDAKKAHFECRVFSYTIYPPTDFYDFDYPQTYSAMELMEINTYAQYLIQNKIIKNLPIPKYVK